MIHLELKVTGIDELEKKLGNLKYKAPTVLARAINRAAEKAKTETKREVADNYYISKKNVAKTITISKASRAKLSAQLRSKGSPIALSKFKVSPNKRVKKTKRGYSPPVYKAAVKKDGGMKPLSDEPKSFLTEFKSGHLGVMRRTSARRLPLKQLYGPTVPSMIKNEKVIRTIQEAASKKLEERIEAGVNNILKGGK